ncbi:MAG: M48 family metallopeptidase [Mangrovibacterium sp.]
MTMRKIVIPGLAIAGSFFLCWFLLMQINWMKLFKVEKAKVETEKKIGELLWDVFRESSPEVTDSAIVVPIDSILTKICTANDIDRENIKLHILEKDEVNAFALPDGHLVIFNRLISETNKPEELAGVIGHELAHIELKHVMKKLVREIGMVTLVSMSGGNNGSVLVKDAARLLSSSAFDRKMETEADETSLDYLRKAKIDPAPLADFLFNLSLSEADKPDYIDWISTHPDTQQRAESLANQCKELTDEYEPVISDESWNRLKEAIDER